MYLGTIGGRLINAMYRGHTSWWLLLAAVLFPFPSGQSIQWQSVCTNYRWKEETGYCVSLVQVWRIILLLLPLATYCLEMPTASRKPF